MAKPLDLNMIRRMEGPRPERWIPVLCDEIERLQDDYLTAVRIREEEIEALKKRQIEFAEGLIALLQKFAE